MNRKLKTNHWGVGPIDRSLPSFRELFCEHYRIKESDFGWVCYRRSLYRRAWLCWPLLRLFRPDETATDRELIEDLATCRSYEEVYHCVQSFQLHWVNAPFLRQHLKMRVSLGRVLGEARMLYSPAKMQSFAKHRRVNQTTPTRHDAAVTAVS